MRRWEEANRLLLERIELAKRWEEDDIARWRQATDREQADALRGLLRLASRVLRARGFAVNRGELEFPRLPSPRA
jgi:hypothetical protein